MKSRMRRPQTGPREARKNQGEFRAIMERYRLTTAGAAALLTEATKRPVSQVTIKSWLVAAGKSAARPCPEWAVTALAEVAPQATDEHRDQRIRRD